MTVIPNRQPIKNNVTEAVLEFECKSEERPALMQELRNSRQAFKVYNMKGSETLVRAEFTSLDIAQSTLAQYRERNFKVTLLTPSKSTSRFPVSKS
jgi:hypothetical protein